MRTIAAVLAAALVVAAAAAHGTAAEQNTAAPQSVEEIAKRSKSSVVTIRFKGRRESDAGLGTGFVVGDGLVATNLHVIGEARPITVELADGSSHEATAVHATDRDGDLAVVRIAARGLVPLPLAEAGTLVDGQEVVAVGNPHGLKRSIVAGRVSALREMNGIEMIQLALPVEPGNSGGPLLDLEGRVHGIVSMKSLVTPNLGFAVSVARLRSLLDRPNPVSMERWLTIGAIDPAQWTPIGGARWRQRAGRISVSGAGNGFGGRSLCLAVAQPPEPPYELAVWVKLDDEAGAAGLAFAADGADRHYGFYPTAGRLRLTRFDGPDVLSWKILDEKPSPRYRAGEWNHLRVRVEADRTSCFVNDALIFTTATPALAGRLVGLAKFRDTKAEFRGFAAGRDLPRAAPAADVMARIEAATAGLFQEDGRAGDEAVRERIVRQLLPDGPLARAGLLRQAAELRQRVERLEALASSVHERRTLDELGGLVGAADAEIDLFHAALLIAKLDNPDLDVAASRRELDRLAADVARAVPAQADEAVKLATLNRVLFDELGFHGSRGDYYNRSNSYVNEVLDDREGIPITLAILYMNLARRLGLTVEGVGFPGRFLVRYEPAGGEPRWLDVFERAAERTREDLAARRRDEDGTEITDDDLAVAAPKAILARMVNNLLGIAVREGDQADVLRYLDAMLAINPDSAPDRVRRMVTAARLGRREAAVADARWLLERMPPEIDLDQVRGLLDRLESDRPEKVRADADRPGDRR
jgi:regulator of sirC expression with transglutaminase-like and TPR domain